MRKQEKSKITIVHVIYMYIGMCVTNWLMVLGLTKLFTFAFGLTFAYWIVNVAFILIMLYGFIYN